MGCSRASTVEYRVMKSILRAFVAATLLPAMLSAQDATSRPEWLNRPVTIDEAGTTEVLTVIERIGEFTLRIRDEDRELFPDGLTMTFTRASIGDVLDFILATAGLSYKIADGKVVHVFEPAKP